MKGDTWHEVQFLDGDSWMQSPDMLEGDTAKERADTWRAKGLRIRVLRIVVLDEDGAADKPTPAHTIAQQFVDRLNENQPRNFGHAKHIAKRMDRAAFCEWDTFFSGLRYTFPGDASQAIVQHLRKTAGQGQPRQRRAWAV